MPQNEFSLPLVNQGVLEKRQNVQRRLWTAHGARSCMVKRGLWQVSARRTAAFACMSRALLRTLSVLFLLPCPRITWLAMLKCWFLSLSQPDSDSVDLGWSPGIYILISPLRVTLMDVTHTHLAGWMGFIEPFTHFSMTRQLSVGVMILDTLNHCPLIALFLCPDFWLEAHGLHFCTWDC